MKKITKDTKIKKTKCYRIKYQGKIVGNVLWKNPLDVNGWILHDVDDTDKYSGYVFVGTEVIELQKAGIDFEFEEIVLDY